MQRLHAALAEEEEEEQQQQPQQEEGCDDEAVGGGGRRPRQHHAAAATDYGAAAAARLRAMSRWMWDGTSSRWHDVEWRNGTRIAQESAASYIPLWAGAHDAVQAEAAVGALGKSGLFQVGGVATTLIQSGQQWDAPNAWPPLQQMLIEGLAACGAPAGGALASTLATNWLRSNWLGWNATGFMHEKYDAARPGQRGGGGEYTPQVGFGWTNGVVLWLLEGLERLGASAEAVVAPP